jgi:HD-GYP domain-containing protein (c-di-GMP phosphodiesterase class II)
LIREAARLHEIGKLYVPAELLARPPAELSPAEWGLVSSHYEQGMALASGAGVPHRACALILHARESYDGSGPGGLQKDEIPLGSRVIAAAAEYLDAPLRAGAPAGDPREIAIERLEELSSSRLDPEVARVAVEAAGGAAG